jgi:small subunit ribosomal protein S20
MPHVPNHPSAIKRHRRSLKRKLRNRAVKTHVHSAVKSAQDAMGSGDSEQAAQALREAMKVLGKAATKGVLHRNTASRKISRLALRLKRVKAQA